jgi:hypothetical protein
VLPVEECGRTTLGAWFGQECAVTGSISSSRDIRYCARLLPYCECLWFSRKRAMPLAHMLEGILLSHTGCCHSVVSARPLGARRAIMLRRFRSPGVHP